MGVCTTEHQSFDYRPADYQHGPLRHQPIPPNHSDYLHHLVPGLWGHAFGPKDPATMRMGRAAAQNPEGLERLWREMGLDRPIYVQYFIWLAGAVQGDFGNSNRSDRPVLELIGGRLGASLELVALSLIISLVVSIPLGVLAAVKRKTLFDSAIMTFAVAGVAIPGFWLGLALILLFSVTLQWLPASGYVPFSENPFENLRRAIMPSLTLSVYLIATFTRFLRSDIIEVIHEDYVRTAKAKGLRERFVILRHALPNALIPLLTVLGVEVGGLLGGIIIIEHVFGWSGVGWLTLQAVYNRDYPLVQGAVLLTTVFYTLMNFAVDVSYAFLNPRIREQYEGVV
ncbi:ABC transporter permease [Chloroflexi bacterium TSY]|nr:ABC transporter permease [Chloroflexi bacterium TSY]